MGEASLSRHYPVKRISEARSSKLHLGWLMLAVAVFLSLLNSPVMATLPVADFSMSTSSGRAPLTVYFTDLSTGSVDSWWWEFGDGSTSSSQNPVHRYTYAGTYAVTLTVYPFLPPGSAMVNPSEKTATVYVKLDPTIVLSPLSGKAGIWVTVTGNNFDVSGLEFAQADLFFNGIEIVSNIWFEGSGFSTSFKVPDGTPPGTYTVQAYGQRDSASTTFTVTNLAPQAQIDASPLSGKTPLAVHFSGSRSYDEDGSISSYRWDFGDGASSEGATADHTYNRPGVYTAKLTVTDDYKKTGSATVTISIENRAPVADARANPTSGSDPLIVNFDGSQSSDPDGTIRSFHWNFGDGTWERIASPTHQYRNLGSYTAVLTVTDDMGLTAQDKVIISVGNEPPVAHVAISPQKGTRPLSVTLDGLQSYDPDDSDLIYVWDFGDGTSGNGATTGHTYLRDGIYHISLLVIDPHGVSSAAHSTIEVEPPFPWVLVLSGGIVIGAGLIALNHFRKPNGTGQPAGPPTNHKVPDPEVRVEADTGLEYPSGLERSGELPDLSIESSSEIWKEGEKL